MFKIDERLPKESAKDYVVRQLVYNIVHINLTPGQQLDSDEISELLNVSKNPIREAELELSQTRLIEIKPKIGAYVSLIDANIVEEVRELRSVLDMAFRYNFLCRLIHSRNTRCQRNYRYPTACQEYCKSCHNNRICYICNT